MRRNGLVSTKAINKSDGLLILFFILISLGIFLFLRAGRSQGDLVSVTVDGRLYGQYPLNQSREVAVQGNGWKNVLSIRDGYADMTEADCPDGICVKHKKIRDAGETIVCLPHKVVVEIAEAAGENTETSREKYDAITD